MFIKRSKYLVWLLTITFFLTQVIVAGPLLAQSTSTGTDRISGADRYKTAVAVSQKGWKTSDYAVLARGDNFADALCAGPLAQKYGGPILLTQPNQLNSDTLKELQRLGVKHLFITGGVGAVSQSVEDDLEASGIATIERIYGSDRYETSVKIAEKIGVSSKAVLVTGSDFPDALSISSIAAKLGMPILLTAKNSLPSGVSNYLQTNTVTQTYIVGGTGVISAAVADSVPNPARLAGNDRYETNKVIMQNFASELNFESIYVAVGSQFADALTGAVLAAKSSSPLVLTGKTLPSGTADYLQTKLKLSTKVKGLGGKNAVSSSILEGLVASKQQISVEEKYSTAGTYGPEIGTKTIQGSVIISAAGVTLRNTTIEGDLLLGSSIGDGDVELRDVTVQGKTIINGGGPNSVIMYNFNGQTVVVDVPDGANVRLVAQGNTTVANVSMEGNGMLQEAEVTGSGFVTVAIPAGAEVVLNGDFNEVNVEAGGANITVASGNITTMNIFETAAGTGVNLGSGSSVGTLNANAPSNFTGQGQITNANVNTSDVTIEQTPTNTTVAEGATANVGGQEQTGTSTPPPTSGGDDGGDSVTLSNNTSVTTKGTYYDVVVDGSLMTPDHNPITANTTIITTAVTVETFLGNLNQPGSSQWKVFASANNPLAGTPPVNGVANFSSKQSKSNSDLLEANDLLFVLAEDGETLRGFHISVDTVPVDDFTSTAITDETVTFTWSAATGATNVKIQLPGDVSGWADATTEALLNAASTTGTVTGLTPETAYQFKLVVEGGAKAGDSNTLDIQTFTVQEAANNEIQAARTSGDASNITAARLNTATGETNAISANQAEYQTAITSQVEPLNSATLVQGLVNSVNTDVAYEALGNDSISCTDKEAAGSVTLVRPSDLDNDSGVTFAFTSANGTVSTVISTDNAVITRGGTEGTTTLSLNILCTVGGVTRQNAASYLVTVPAGTGAVTWEKNTVESSDADTAISSKDNGEGSLYYTITVHESERMPASNPVVDVAASTQEGVTTVGTFIGNINFPAGADYKIAQALATGDGPVPFEDWDFALITGKSDEETLANDDLLLVLAADGTTLRGYRIMGVASDR